MACCGVNTFKCPWCDETLSVDWASAAKVLTEASSKRSLEVSPTSDKTHYVFHFLGVAAGAPCAVCTFVSGVKSTYESDRYRTSTTKPKAGPKRVMAGNLRISVKGTRIGIDIWCRPNELKPRCLGWIVQDLLARGTGGIDATAFRTRIAHLPAADQDHAKFVLGLVNVRDTPIPPSASNRARRKAPYMNTARFLATDGGRAKLRALIARLLRPDLDLSSTGIRLFTGTTHANTSSPYKLTPATHAEISAVCSNKGIILTAALPCPCLPLPDPLDLPPAVRQALDQFLADMVEIPEPDAVVELNAPMPPPQPPAAAELALLPDPPGGLGVDGLQLSGEVGNLAPRLLSRVPDDDDDDSSSGFGDDDDDPPADIGFAALPGEFGAVPALFGPVPVDGWSSDCGDDDDWSSGFGDDDDWSSGFGDDDDDPPADPDGPVSADAEESEGDAVTASLVRQCIRQVAEISADTAFLDACETAIKIVGGRVPSRADLATVFFGLTAAHRVVNVVIHHYMGHDRDIDVTVLAQLLLVHARAPMHSLEETNLELLYVLANIAPVFVGDQRSIPYAVVKPLLATIDCLARIVNEDLNARITNPATVVAALSIDEGVFRGRSAFGVSGGTWAQFALVFKLLLPALLATSDAARPLSVLLAEAMPHALIILRYFRTQVHHPDTSTHLCSQVYAHKIRPLFNAIVATTELFAAFTASDPRNSPLVVRASAIVTAGDAGLDIIAALYNAFTFFDSDLTTDTTALRAARTAWNDALARYPRLAAARIITLPPASRAAIPPASLAAPARRSPPDRKRARPLPPPAH